MEDRLWEARQSRRWGSATTGTFKTREEAMGFAMAEILKNGNVGRIGSVIPDKLGGRVYYDIHEDDS